MKCEYCDMAVPVSATTCPWCGAPLQASEPQTPVAPQRPVRRRPQLSSYVQPQAMPPPSPYAQPYAMPYAPAYIATPKSRAVYIILALFFGLLGIHNFYARRSGAGVAQLLLTLFLGWLIIPILVVVIWVIIEMICVTRDGLGVPFV